MRAGGPFMALSRRDLLQAVLIAPVAVTAGAAASATARMVARTVATLRPGASGSSATRCARCGDPGHTMLQPGCPLERKVT